MRSDPNPLSGHLGVGLVDRARALEVVGLVFAVLIPIVGLPLSLHLLRRARDEGRDDHLAKLGLHIAVFLLSLYVVIMLVGLTLSVVVPLLTASR